MYYDTLIQKDKSLSSNVTLYVHGIKVGSWKVAKAIISDWPYFSGVK